MALNKYKFKTNEDEGLQKLPFQFNITMLNSFIGYLFKQSRQITRKSMTNMKRIFDIIDERPFENNAKMAARVQFIRRALQARLVNGMENEDIMINFCRSDNSDPDNEEIIASIERYKKINYEEIKFINNAIQDRLKYAYMLRYAPRIYELADRLESGEYDSFKQINDRFTELCRSLLNETRKASVLEDHDTFSLDDEMFDENLTDMVNRIKDPARILKTGIRGLNQILAPGYLSKRLYIYMGLPAGFKSGILLKSVRDIKKYNKDIPTKKAGKRKTVLLVTMENTVEESIERLFNMTVTTDDIRNYTAKQIIKMLKEEGEMTLENDDDINILIKYYPNQSIDTSDLHTIIEEVEDEGREVIALVLDYIKRIRPAARAKDEKEELKNVTNELKNLAIEKDIPVITAHQLNRGAATVVDAAMTENKEDITRFVGRGNVGSAWEVIENADWVCVVNVEKKRASDQYYLTFKRVKIRYRDPLDLAYFNQPFEIGNRIRLLDDVHLETSLAELSLATDFEGVVDINALRTKKSAKDRDTGDTGDESEDLFDFGSDITRKKRTA